MLKAVIDKLEDVVEPLREHYKPGADGKFVLAADGVEDVSGLKTALKSERDAAEAARKLAKELKDAVKGFEGLDPTEVRNLMEQFANDEDMKLIAAGKHSEVISKKTEKMRLGFEKQIKDLTEQHTKELEAERKRSGMYQVRVLENEIRAAAGKAGLHTYAVDDALFRAKSIFVLDDEGRAVQKREDGTVVAGKNGKDPFSPLEWLESMRDPAPHWFPAGGGGTGSTGSTTNGKGTGQRTMKRADFVALSPADQRKAALVDKVAIVD